MPRPALSAARAVTIVNFLTGRPGEAFTLSELARGLDVNPASLHSVLAVLEREGFLERDGTRKSYRLGSSLVAVGQAALDDQPVIHLAREKAATLADELQLESLVTIPVGLEFLIVGAAGRPERLQFRPRVGQRLPFDPPLGIMSAGFLPEPEREAWLDRIGPKATKRDRDAYRSAALAVRSKGYEIDLETPARERIGRVMAELAADPRSPELHSRLRELVIELGHEQHHLLDPEPGVLYRVNNITMPIFGRAADVAVGLTLLGFDEPLDVDAIAETVTALKKATELITRTTGGRIPLDL